MSRNAAFTRLKVDARQLAEAILFVTPFMSPVEEQDHFCRALFVEPSKKCEGLWLVAGGNENMAVACYVPRASSRNAADAGDSKRDSLRIPSALRPNALRVTASATLDWVAWLQQFDSGQSVECEFGLDTLRMVRKDVGATWTLSCLKRRGIPCRPYWMGGMAFGSVDLIVDKNSLQDAVGRYEGEVPGQCPSLCLDLNSESAAEHNTHLSVVKPVTVTTSRSHNVKVISQTVRASLKIRGRELKAWLNKVGEGVIMIRLWPGLKPILFFSRRCYLVMNAPHEEFAEREAI